MGGETLPPRIPEEKKRAVRINCQRPSISRRKMSLSRFEVYVRDGCMVFMTLAVSFNG